MEIKLNMVFKATKDNQVAKVIKVDDKCGTAMVRFEDDSTKVYSFGTLKDKRRFHLIGEELPDEEYAKIGKEIAEQAKQKAEELKVSRYEAKTDLFQNAVEEEEEEPKLVPMPGAEKLADLKESGKKPRITITYNGKTQTPSEWAKEYGMDPKRIRLALRKGKSPEEIFNGKN